MPNWTTNEVTYEGDKKEIERLISFMGPDFSFNAIKAMPESLEIESGSKTIPAIVVYLADKLGSVDAIRQDRDTMRFLEEAHGYCFSLTKFITGMSEIIGRYLPTATVKEKEDALAAACRALKKCIERTVADDSLTDLLKRMEKDIPEMDEKDHQEMVDLGRRYAENLEQHGAATWYEWRCKNWGTKWPAREVSMKRHDPEEPYEAAVTWSFDTAWCMPGPIYDAVGKEFPTLTYTYRFQNEDNWEDEYTLRHTPVDWDDFD